MHFFMRERIGGKTDCSVNVFTFKMWIRIKYRAFIRAFRDLAQNKFDRDACA